ncbi:transcriptional regulator [Flavipsychrobacter stenotrophus]|uniref:Transcriptional regulator n=1 Tax=Flavipsychrobacter stenotrophus TaxID=2077091 RepID=A0A2S7SV56_9BACT|nr:BlaI/MecI/CopY family transcriptional regulator [Flavipsychrobacter stenotrophus]PQJ10800.1 transcriptional regulator [Flavipsychrobacter stenotrophus]
MEQIIKPTEAEMEILNILWADGPATVREVHEKLAQTKDAGYTTTLKQMQVMLEKKLVNRDASSKTHVYNALVNKEQTQGQFLQRMIDTVFNGSAMNMVMQALGNKKTSKAEVELIKAYLKEKTKE